MKTSIIEKKSLNLLIDNGMLKRPIKVEKLAKSIGLKIDYQDVDDEVSGFLVLKDNKNIIGVNENHHAVRRRFTISHDLGHYMLHINEQALFVDYYKGNKLYRSTSKEYNYKMERQANQFAASLLMPELLISEEIEKLSESMNYDRKLEKLSKLFQVSAQAMDFRLKALGYYDYGF